MPKLSKYPRLRTHIKRGKAGQVWVSYWYDNRGFGKDIPLGSDYAAALIKWGAIRSGAPTDAGTVEEALQKYEAEILPGLNPETRRDYTKSIRMLRPVFGPASWDHIRLPDLVAYLKARKGKTRANRELSVLSVVWNKARQWGMTEKPWPAHGMKHSGWKNKEGARAVEVTDEAFAAIYKHADQTLRDAMDLCSSLGCRVRDALSLQVGAVKGEVLKLTSGKRGKFGKFSVSASEVLPPLIARRLKSKAPHVFMLVCGNRVVTERMLRDRFALAREAASKEVPEAAGLQMNYMRKYAAQQAETLEDARKLLQHSSAATTQRHYRAGDTIKPAR